MKNLKNNQYLYKKRRQVHQLIFIMKLMFVFLFAGMVSIHAEVFSQTYTFSLKNAQLRDVIRNIEKESDYRFFFSDDVANLDQTIQVDVTNATIDQLLNTILSPYGLGYKKLENNLIIISPYTATDKVQQGIPVTGIIVDAEGKPIPGTNVIIKGTTTGVVTDIIGKFNINVPDSESVLQFSFVGFVTQEIMVGNQRVINVTLLEDMREIEEVVVVGYGVQRKSDVTGSISVATAEDILAAPSFNALQGLKGKASGVNVFVNTGNPLGINGSAPRVVIRGMNSINTSTDPLYVVDGVQMSEIQFINPNEIERMEVLKDASATAIYGARGANGVILITTKRGSTGTSGITVTYSGWVSLGRLSKEVSVMNASEFMQMEDRAFANIGKYQQGRDYLAGLGVTELKVDRTDPMIFDANGNPLYDTNWQREATRSAWSQSHQLNIQQQGNSSSVGAFINFTDQQGILINNEAKRINGKLTYDAQPVKWLDISTNILVNHMWGNGVDDTGGGLTARRTIWEMLPILPVKFPDGSWATSQFKGNKLNLAQEAMTNPVHELTERKMERFRTKMFGNLAFSFHLADGLDLRTQIGVDANVRTDKNYVPNNMINISTRGLANISNSQDYYWQEETYLSYNKVLANIHRVNATLGMSWSKYATTNANTGNVQDFDENFQAFNDLAAGKTPSAPTSGWGSWSMNSYFARASYALKDKYLATLTLRADGSSRFGANKKYAFFPSAGLGWVISNEDFMRNTSWINNLKLHTSYGRTGNTEISSYSTLATASSSTTLINNARQSTVQMSRMANPDLEWEKTDQFDVGINLNMFKNRVNLEVDYYYKKTFDLLLARPIPISTGFTSVMDNMGRVDNSGIDFLLNAINIERENFTWESTLNLNYNQNTIKKLGENDEDILTDPAFLGGNIILRVGEAMSSFYGYERYGTWGTAEAAEAAKVSAVPGEAKRSTERKIIGNGMPKLTGSFINKFYYKNWDLIVDLQFVTGVDTWQHYFHTSEDRTGYISGLSTILYDGWTETNQNTMVQQIRHRVYSGHNTTADSHWVSDGSYLRGNLIQLGYMLDSKILQRWKIKSFRVNFGVSNAFLIHSKDFKGYDPEGSSNTNRFGQNVFFYQYPTARTYTLGLNFSF